MTEELCIVPDTSVIIDGRITEKLKAGEYAQAKVIIAEALIAELEAQANKGKETGFKGLEELKELSEMAKSGEITIEYTGKGHLLSRSNLHQQAK